MALKLIAEDAALSIALGGVHDGTIDPHPSSGTPTLSGSPTLLSLIGIAKRFSHDEETGQTNVKAAGDGREKHRYHSLKGTIEIEAFTPSTGYVVPPNQVQKYIEVTYKPLSSLSSGTQAVGVVTSWKEGWSTAGEQTVSITIDLEPDYLATS